MSRTDRDRPYRVRSADPHEPREAVHSHVCRRWRHEPDCPHDLGCDLPDYHDRTPDSPTDKPRWTRPNCYWRLTYWVFSPYGGGPPKWYRDARWHNPERGRVRAHNVEWRKVANAGGDLEDWDLACWATHHEGGYWD
jgi:hypothetical protein